MKAPIKNGTVNAVKTHINKSTNFTLKGRIGLPDRGLHKGVVGEITQETGIENGKEVNRIDVPILLEGKDADGKNYQLHKLYNVDDNKRGLNALRKDYFAWSGVQLNKVDLLMLDYNSVLKGNIVVVDVDYRVERSKVVAFIKAFYQADNTGEQAMDTEVPASAEA